MKSYLAMIVIFGIIFLLGAVNTDGICQEFQKSLKQLTFDPGTDYYPSWSPEGSFIAFDSDMASVVRIISPNGGISVRIVPVSIKTSRGAHPCWSLDGSKVTFSAEGDIWIVDLSTGNLKKFFHKDGYYARAFSWSPDGKFISADVGENDKRDDDVWLLPTDGGEPVILTQFPGREGNPYFSPDGSMVIYMSALENKRALWVISAKGGKPVKITTYEGFNANPRWSPDGSKIAFASDRSGNADIWVMEIDIDLIKKKLSLSN